MSSRIDRRIAELSEINSLLDDLRHRLAVLPMYCHEDVAVDLREIADSLCPPRAPAKSPARTDGPEDPDEGAGSVATRMRQWFEQADNTPATIQAIAEAVGAQIESVKSVLYKRNRGRFEQVRTASPGNPALWRTATSDDDDVATSQGKAAPD